LLIGGIFIKYPFKLFPQKLNGIMKQYTNEITSTLINTLKNPFPAERWANADAEELHALNSCVEEMKDRSLLQIWRFATTGAVTRDGGIIEHGSASDTFTLSDGIKVSRAMVGDYVVYPDATRARIVSGSGSVNTCGGISYALVGSLLDNGDVIVSTPQDLAFLCQWDNSPAMPVDFLTPVSR